MNSDEVTGEEVTGEGAAKPPPPSRPRPPYIRPRRTPTVLQMEAVECGAASLGIMLGYYGRFVPLERLRVDCGVSRDGSNAANVMAAGQTYGLTGGGFKVEPDAFDQLTLPCIIFWNFNHFLVLEGFRRGKAYLNDPAAGRRTVTEEEFDRCFSGIVLALRPGPEFKRGGRKPSVVRALSKRLRGIRIAVTFLVLAGLGLVIPGLAIPTFSKIFVDEVLIGGSRRWLFPLLIGLAIAALLRAALTALQAHFLMRASTKLAIATTGRFLWHVLRLPVEFFQQRYAGDVSSRIASNERVAAVLTGELATSVIGLLTATFYVGLMLRYDAVLTGVGIVIATINLLLLRFISRTRTDESQKMLQDSGKLRATAMGGIQSIESIKATARESDFFSRWAGYQAKATMAGQRLAASSAFLDTVPISLSLLSTAIVLGVGGLRVIDGTLTIGMLVAFQTLLNSFYRPVNDLVRLADVIQRLTGDMKRLDDVAHYQADQAFAAEGGTGLGPVEGGTGLGPVEGGTGLGPVGGTGLLPVGGTGLLPVGDTGPRPVPPPPARRLSGFVELRAITFGYSRLAEPLLVDFSLTLSPGDRIALVGSSGSGKSTVARLLSGLYRPWSGDILFDNKPRESWSRPLLANSFAMVDQDIFFFEGAVRDNIALWDHTLPDEAIQRAAKDACIHDDITSRRGAYASTVDEAGRNFSGGQRQRLEIARALANDPTILVMDEATSALDAATEKIVDDRIRRRGCTCVIIAHRLSTIRDCNEIIVLERGKVVQRGTHEELIAVEGPYQRLIRTE